MAELLAELIGPVSPTGLVLAVVTAAVAGFIRGFIGFGAALIIIMMLSVIFGPHVAVPVSALASLPGTLQLLPTAVRHAEPRLVVPLGIAVLVAAPFGTMILVAADPVAIRIGISVFVLVMVYLFHRGWRLARQPGRGLLLGVGALAGLIQGAAGVGGPPAVIVTLARPGSAERQRANVIGVITALSLCPILPLWYHGLFTREVVVIALVIVLPYLGLTWAGGRYFARRGHRHFQGAALLTLAAVGAVTLALAIGDFMA